MLFDLNAPENRPLMKGDFLQRSVAIVNVRIRSLVIMIMTMRMIVIVITRGIMIGEMIIRMSRNGMRIPVNPHVYSPLPHIISNLTLHHFLLYSLYSHHKLFYTSHAHNRNNKEKYRW